MVAMVLLRTVHRDISRYNAMDVEEDVQEDYGWKLIHGEVFRAPKHRMFLSVVVGSGMQLAAMSTVTLCEFSFSLFVVSCCTDSLLSPVFALLGFLSPSNRGSLSTVMIVCWTLFGVSSSIHGTCASRSLHFCLQFIAGYISTRLYVSMRGEDWRKNIALTALLFPT